MGSVLVENMGQSGIGEPSSQKLHPFFVKDAASDSIANRPTPSCHIDPRLSDADGSAPVFDSRDGGHPAKRHKLAHPASHHATDTETLPPSYGDDGSGAPSTQPCLANVAQPFPPCQNNEQPILYPALSQDESQPRPNAPIVSNEASNNAAQVAPPTTSLQPPEPTLPSEGKKVLKLNPKTGTLGSPPKVKQKSKPSHIVCIKYGQNEISRMDIGEKVTQILNGTLQLPKTPTKKRSNKRQSKANNTPADLSTSTKAAHPFFSGKSKDRSSTPTHSTDSTTKSPVRKNSVFMSTPVSPRKSRNPFSSAIATKMPQFGNKSGGTKVPGAKHPMWPAQGMSHIRGDDYVPLCATNHVIQSGGYKKSKGHVTTIGPSESVLAIVVDRIDIEGLRRSLPQDNDSFTPAPAELRIPQKRCESGRQLQHRIRPQLTNTSPLALAGVEDTSVDELAGPAPAIAHPAITRHYKSLESRLSAYDKSTCESSSWNQKYAPVSAAQVLQKGKDALLIKVWLEAMKVQSVETGSGDAAGDKGRQKAETVPKKKRKKNKVDDFIVDTDEEGSELEEISENEEDENSGSEQPLKTVVRSGGIMSKQPGRLKNTVVISGPHGCGKTTAVYAIAKELDFEIFEINSSSRRSGKDVLEKVGDMTRNHLVQQHRAQQSSADGVPNDVGAESKSGKQGIMTAFFKAKVAPEKKEKPKQTTSTQAKQKPTPRGQKQSLILIEEADILYEEDKQFWAVLMGMMNQSRRPFVITCNDESLVPLLSLNIHGIFRFSPAPVPLAVDLCLLIAANEGHSLRRSAVESLYQARNNDLRATLSDLNFWCQIGVGDRRGGFDWFYTRWPKGCDLDDRGDVVRVLSENTFQNGMGWMGRDVMVSECDRYDREVEAMQQSWNFWQLDLGDWSQSMDLGPLATATWESARTSEDRYMALEVFDQFYEAMSDADLCSAGSYSTLLQEAIDPSLPALPSNARDDFIMGRALLEADGYAHPTVPSKAISMALKSQARARLCFRSEQMRQSADSLGLRSIDESTTVSMLDASFRSSPRSVTRMDIAYAFDPIAVPPKALPTSYLDPSVFDRTLRLIVLDVAPWVRGIVAFEHQLMQERLKLNNILTEGGTRKRMRNTRSAYSALEGGERRSTRKEQYFGDCLSTGLVMRTGGKSWHESVAENMRGSMVEEESAASQQAPTWPTEEMVS